MPPVYLASSSNRRPAVQAASHPLRRRAAGLALHGFGAASHAADTSDFVQRHHEDLAVTNVPFRPCPRHAADRLDRAFQEVFFKDYLLPKEEYRFSFNFFPHPPIEEINGQIIDVFNGVAQIGQYNVVVLDVGERDGVEPGHVMAIYQKGERVRDPDAIFSWSKIDLPDERAGVLMVFKTYEKLSYALVMEAQRALHVNDRVTNP